MGAAEPPRHIAPTKLFRLLLRRPRPIIEIAHRFAGAEHVQLYVRALRSCDIGDAYDAAEHVPAEVQGSRTMLELVARALVIGTGAPVFSCGLELADLLDEREAHSLSLEVYHALGCIGPTYARSDAATWHRTLVAGAREPVNLHDAYVLGRCVDTALGAGLKQITHRPDRYFGCAMADITDGQWMAFRAARSVVEDASTNGSRK